LNSEKKVIFIFDIKNEINKENTLLKISYFVYYFKLNNALYLKDLINYINSNYEIDLKYHKYFHNIVNNLDDIELYKLLFKNKCIENIIKLFKEEKNNELFFEYINYYIKNNLKDLTDSNIIKWFSNNIFKNKNFFKRKLNYPLYLIINSLDNEELDNLEVNIEDYYSANVYTEDKLLNLLLNKINSFKKLYYCLKFFNSNSLSIIYINIIQKISELNDFSYKDEQIYIGKSIKYVSSFVLDIFSNIKFEISTILIYLFFIKVDFDLKKFFFIFQKLDEEKFEKLKKIFQKYHPKCLPNIEKYIISNIYFNSKMNILKSINKYKYDIIDYIDAFNYLCRNDFYRYNYYDDDGDYYYYYQEDYFFFRHLFTYNYEQYDFIKDINKYENEEPFYKEILKIFENNNIKFEGKALKINIYDVIDFLDNKMKSNNIFFILQKIFEIKLFDFSNLVEKVHYKISINLIMILCNPKYLYLHNNVMKKLKIIVFGQNKLINILKDNLNKCFEVALLLDYQETIDNYKTFLNFKGIIPTNIRKIIIFYLMNNNLENKIYKYKFYFSFWDLEFHYKRLFSSRKIEIKQNNKNQENISHKDYDCLISLIKKLYPFYKTKKFQIMEKEEMKINLFNEFYDLTNEIQDNIYKYKYSLKLDKEKLYFKFKNIIKKIIIDKKIKDLDVAYNSEDISNLEYIMEDKLFKYKLFKYLESLREDFFFNLEDIYYKFSFFDKCKMELYILIKEYLNCIFDKIMKEKLKLNLKKKSHKNKKKILPQIFNESINQIIENFVPEIIDQLKKITSKKKEFASDFEKFMIKTIFRRVKYNKENLEDMINIFFFSLKNDIKNRINIIPLKETKTYFLKVMSFIPKYLYTFNIQKIMPIVIIINQICDYLNISNEKKIYNEVIDLFYVNFSKFFSSYDLELKQEKIADSQFHFKENRDILKNKLEIVKKEENIQITKSLIEILKLQIQADDINEKIKIYFNGQKLLSEEFDILKNIDDNYEMIINLINLEKFYSISDCELKKDLEDLKFCFDNNIPGIFISDTFSKLENLKKIYIIQYSYISELIEIYNLIKDSTKDNILEIFLFEDEIQDPDKIIENLISMKNFYNETKNLEKKSLEVILNELKKKLLDNQYSKIFEELYAQRNIIKDLFYKQYNQANYILFQSKKIMKDSSISVELVDKKLDCNMHIRNKPKIPFLEIIYLKDSAKLILQDKKRKAKRTIETDSNKNKENEIEKSIKEIEIIRKFIEVIEIIQKILKLIEIINYQGLNLKIYFNIWIKNYNEINYSFSNQLKFNTSNGIYELYDYFLYITEFQEQYEEEILLNKEISRIIFGANFSDIYKYLLDKNISIIYFLNQYLEIKEIPKSIVQKKPTNTSLVLSEKLDNANLGASIKEIYTLAFEYLEECKVDINNFLNKSILKENKKEGIFTYFYEEDIKYEDLIFDIFLNETYNLPNNKSILIWNKYTTKSQLLSFLYLSLLHKRNNLFLLIIKENIQKDIYSFFLEKLDKMKELIENMKSCLIILYSEIDKVFLRGLRNIEHKIYDYKSILENKEKIKKKINDWNIIYYKSNVSGLGKSEMIKNEFLKIKDNKIKYIYFPISGTINEKEIMDRLIKIKEDNAYFHIDIIEINDKSREIIREFLFDFLILKVYFYQNKIFSYQSSNFKIIIEIYSNYFEDFPILSYCKGVNIEDEPNYELYKFDTKIAKIFKYLDENGKNINKLNIADFEKEDNLNQVEIIGLFRKYFMNTNKTFYQIENFSKILNLNIEYYISLIKDSPEIKILNYDIIVSLISMSKRISESYYEKLIESKINKNNELDKKNTLFDNYKKIKNFFIFNEDKKSFSIIPNENANNFQFEENIIKNILKFDSSYKPLNFLKLNNDEIHVSINSFLNSNKLYKLLISINKFYSKLENIKIKDVKKPISLKFEKLLNELANIETSEEKTTEIKEEKIEKEKLKQFKEEMEKNIFNEDFKKEIINKIEEYLKKGEAYKINDSIINCDDKEIQNISPLEFIEKRFKEINYLFLEIIKSMNYEYKEELKDFLNLFEALKYYIFTYDNYLKFIFIIMKLRADLPVILMGETGVGKTALIKILINSLPYKKKLIIKEIHNGIDNKELEEFIKENNFFEENNLKEENNNEEKEVIYILLDEMNSCYSMGLLSEMMIKHSFLGKKLKGNIKFLGTCNPIKKISNNNKLSYGLINPKSNLKDKEYNVNKLPQCLLNFVFDFGCLKVEDEKKYIEQIAKKIISKLNYIEESSLVGIKELIKDTIEFSQMFFRNTFDRTSVSLRDLRRYNIFFDFYYKLIKQNKIKFTTKDYKNEDERIAILLTLYICYYIRIRDEEYKKKYLDKIKTNYFYYLGEEKEKLEDLYQEIIDNFCSNFDKSKLKGIALNRVIKQNLFCLFSCILSKVPIIICGEPGCSKSLSFNIIESHMKKETNEYFKDFPIINKISYQGSEASTSEGILRIYNKVINSIKNDEEIRKKENKKKREQLFLFFFDEMGLADVSPYEPLKVIHSILEFDKDYDNNIKKFPFVGISNWILDSSKMNRGIYLNVPLLNENDLNETFKEIFKSFDKEQILQKYNNIFSILSKTYLEFVNEKEYNGFYGLRDFYNLFKIICLKSQQNNKDKQEKIQNIWKIILESIERNFGGKKNSVNKFKELLFKNCTNAKIEIEKNQILNGKFLDILDIKECIFENIDCKEKVRNILIIYEDSSLFNYIIKFILEDKNKPYEFYLGSLFNKDINDETQINLAISEIGLNIKEGKIIIFQDFDSIYPSLYDLFNQSYLEKNGKLYTKISLGYSSDVLFEVNQNFRSIILVDPEKLDQFSFPLLNRFEKQIVCLNNLLNNEEIKLGKTIYDNLISLFKNKKNDKKPYISLINEVINLNQEEIYGLIYELKHKGRSLTYEKARNYIYRKFANILTQDVIAFSKYSQLKDKNKNEYNIIIENYINQHLKFNNLKTFLEQMKIDNNDIANMKENDKQNSYYIHNVIITFSPYFKSIFQESEIKNSYLNETFSATSSINIIEIEELNSKQELFNKINAYLENKEQNLCFIKFNNNYHLQFVQISIENIMRKEKKEHKHFILILYK